MAVNARWKKIPGIFQAVNYWVNNMLIMQQEMKLPATVFAFLPTDSFFFLNQI
jgi:hypothetical protein